MGSNHWETALMCGNAAYTYSARGRYEKAEKLYKKVWAFAKLY